MIAYSTAVYIKKDLFKAAGNYIRETKGVSKHVLCQNYCPGVFTAPEDWTMAWIQS